MLVCLARRLVERPGARVAPRRANLNTSAAAYYMCIGVVIGYKVELDSNDINLAFQWRSAETVA
ncbi:MAG TPA: hypothetical protein VJH03_21710 [Blastocatellia bacterium]|nr:hypothetical protein [Blastocatellia bacterium]